MPVSECDSCPKPGACCQNFPLPAISLEQHPTLLDAMIAAASRLYSVGEDKGRDAIGLPFIPVKPTTEVLGEACYLWQCVNLLPNGRCGDYEHRPYGPCVLYKPGADRLCAISPDHKPWT